MYTTRPGNIKILLLFLLSVLVAEAVSSTHRLSAIRPGDSCAGIMQIEASLGSHELTDAGPTGIRKYAGELEGEAAAITYTCKKGVLTEQKIVITVSSRDQAYTFANAQRAQLTSRLGEPLHDGLDLGIWRRLFLGFKGADLEYLTTVVVWGGAPQDVMLSIRQTGKELWEISISQGTSKTEYFLNS